MIEKEYISFYKKYKKIVKKVFMNNNLKIIPYSINNIRAYFHKYISLILTNLCIFYTYFHIKNIDTLKMLYIITC